MKTKASLTVFLALILGMMLAVVFGFLEAARVSGLNANAQMQSMQASDSLLSEYHAGVWEDYGVLFWEAENGDVSRAAERQQYFLLHNNARKTPALFLREYPFLELEPERFVVDAYELATDNGGAPFREQAVIEAKKGLAESALSELTDAISQNREEGIEEEDVLRMEEEAEGMDQKLEEQTADAGQEVTADQPETVQETEDPAQAAKNRKLKKDNPIKWMIRLKKEGILAVVMQDKAVSEKERKNPDPLAKRSLNQGNYGSVNAGGSVDRLWFQLYLQQHFSDASRESKGGALDYEMEYLLAGKNRDADNLKAVVNRLLLMREGMNYLYLLHDREKCEEALLLATAIASAFGQPELAEPVKHAILLAWAYAESISDVRILLDGGKIAPVKTKSQWRTSLDHLSGDYQGEAGGKDSRDQKGLTYTQYLQLMLLTERDEKINYRAMDLIEQRENVRMDQMVSRLKCSYLFQAQPLFWRFVTLGQTSFGGLSFQTEQKLSYLPAGSEQKTE